MNNSNKITVAIADDQQIFRRGILVSLANFTDLHFVTEVSNGTEMIASLNYVRPDVVLLDMRMPDMDGVEVCKAIKKEYPQIHVIGLSVYDHYHYISSLFEAGGSGYVLKDADPQEIYEAIKTVVIDGAYIHENSSVKLIQRLIDLNHPSVYLIPQDAVPLRDIEIDILKLIAQEKTNQDIAETLNLSKRTIDKYRLDLLTKVGAKNTAGLVTYAIKKGIVIL